MITVLGASAEAVGLIEGVGEAPASITKLFSGFISGRLGKRKVLTVIGYALVKLSSPFEDKPGILRDGSGGDCPLSHLYQNAQ